MTVDKTNAVTLAPQQLIPAKDSVTVRLYRIGHGDCFLLAFPTADAAKPCYVLIDCGYKPGSSNYLGVKPDEITADLKAATNGFIDVVVVTHEHQDHINGFTEKNFQGIRFGECWFAWTEDPDDAVANQLRQRFNDRLQCVAQARQHLAGAEPGCSSDNVKNRIADFLAFELGGEDDNVTLELDTNPFAMAAAVAESANKRAMKLVRTLTEGDIKYLRPHDEVLKLPGVAGARVFTLGPPTDEALLHSLNPEGDESFKDSAPASAFGAHSGPAYFAAAVSQWSEGKGDSPFAARYRVDWKTALAADGGSSFWLDHYGDSKANPGPNSGGHAGASLNANAIPNGNGNGNGNPNGITLQQGPASEDEVKPDAPWRRIDLDWLHSSEQLALAMNNDTNNGSLVLAFELEPGGKVLLFAADAQRGNWISWTRGTWKDGEREVTAQSLLSRTVLYKVGHHGSHNATLDGKAQSEHANLSWMGQGNHAGEFSAMITAVRAWAEKQKGWDHPLKAIKDALLEKAAGRVFQTDTEVATMQIQGPAAAGDDFGSRVKSSRLYIDYHVKIN